MAPKVRKFLNTKEGRGRGRFEKVDYGAILSCLRQLDLLPAIFFLKSRADCDRALATCSPIKKTAEHKRRVKGALKKFLKDYPHLEGHRQIEPLVDSLVGSHHGGQLPYWKVLIEQMMKKGFLEAIFSTSTVAAGVNFPARSVVLFQSDRYNGHEFVDLNPTALHQMIGRAGRRGMDNIGFAVVVPGHYQNPKLIHDLLDSPSDPILSQIHINFSMTLNLLLSHTPLEIKDLLERSLASYQEKGRGALQEKRMAKHLEDLKERLPKALCDPSDPYEMLDIIQRYAEVQKALKRPVVSAEYARRVTAVTPYLVPGRLFVHRNKNIYVVFKAYVDQERLICAAHNIRKKDHQTRRQLTLRRVDLAQIQDIFDRVVELPDDYSRDGMDRIFDDMEKTSLKVLPIVIPDSEPAGLPSLNRKKEALQSMPCTDCAHSDLCHGKKDREFNRLLQFFRSYRQEMQASESGLWLSFKSHLRFLKETGFVDPDDRLTADGQWACNLRVDQPLLIAESIRQGALDGLSPELMVGALAPFVWDRSQEVELKRVGGLDFEEALKTFDGILDCIRDFVMLKDRRGFATPPLFFWPSAVLYMWARGVPWEILLDVVAVGEGDLASLIMRTADHLRQVAALRETHPELADTAVQGIELILREPVYLF